MKKIIIIGCPGSGKSTFARELSFVTEMPLCHLDMLFWNKDKTTVSRDVLISRIREVMNSSKWIIDGNYISTMEMRLRECDTVFFLDYPVEVCLGGIDSRKGQPRSDMPWVEDDRADDEFVGYIKSFNQQIRPQIVELLKKYSSKNVIVFNSREESDKFLQSLQKI